MKKLTYMSRCRIITYLKHEGYNEDALGELTDSELKRIFILTLALNSNCLN